MNHVPFDPYDFFGYLAPGLLLLVGIERAFGFPHLLGADLKVVDTAVLLLAVYVAGQLVAGPAKTVLEDLLVGGILGRPNVNLFRPRRPWVRSIFFPGFYSRLPDPIRLRVLEKARRDGIAEPGEALFLHVRYSPAILADDKAMVRITAFLNRYGLTRNLAFTCLLITAAMGLKAWLIPHAPPELTRDAIIATVVGILLFYRFLKFYRQHSYELFNLYAGRP